MISNRLGEGKNKYTQKEPIPKGESTYITYLDANNLYGWAMSKYLPIRNFQWVNKDQISVEDILKMTDTQAIGYIFEVDIEYSNSLHDLHNDYPLAVESLTVTKDMLSPYNNEVLINNKLTHTECKKLVPNLMNKKNYVCHYATLKQYLELRLKVTKIHKILSFEQEPWMKPYIDYNSEMRAKPDATPFDKDFYKLMNNSVYGKTMENVRMHMEAKIINTTEKKDKMIKNPRLKNWTIWDENYGLFELNKKVVKLNKPIQVGIAVLEISKTLMYDFHYNYFLKKYGASNVKLLFTDTDSLCYEVRTEDFFDDMIEDSHLYDLSDFPKDHKCYNTTNKKVIGKFKLETLDDVATEFVGLKSKMYSLLTLNTEKKTLKGMAKCVKENIIKHANYLEVLMNGKVQRESQNTIRSFNHDVYSINMKKISLSAVNDKKYLIDNIRGYSYGHYAIPK
jgi:hypothetical protein